MTDSTGIFRQGTLLFCFTQLLLAFPKDVNNRLLPDEDEQLLELRFKNVSSDCYRNLIECNSRCAVACDESEECDGVRGPFYQCASNYWLVIILLVVLVLFLIVFLVACQCVDKGQGCANVDLYPRILGNHRRSQRRGINTVQYFTAVRAGQNRKASGISHGLYNHRASESSYTSSAASGVSNYRFL